jgi:DNA invertase Pin-like site-specific DNA recombinase
VCEGIRSQPSLPNGCNRDSQRLRQVLVVYAGEKAIRSLLKVHVCSLIDTQFMYAVILTNASLSIILHTESGRDMKKAAIYVRVSTPEQHVESQLYDLRELAAQRGFEVVHEYEDRGVCGKKARRPGLDALMADARRKKFSVVLVAAFDRIARSTRNFLQIVDELDSLGIEFVSRREGVATGDAMGRLFMTIISAIAELERSLVAERVKSGMRRAKAEGKVIGRARLDVNREQVIIDRRSGMSLTQVAEKHAISRASVCRLMKERNGVNLPVPIETEQHGMEAHA